MVGSFIAGPGHRPLPVPELGRRAGSRQVGLSLVELLIVVVVLAVLAGIVVFGVGSFRADSQRATDLANLKLLNLASSTYHGRAAAGQELNSLPSDADRMRALASQGLLEGGATTADGLVVPQVAGAAFVWDQLAQEWTYPTAGASQHFTAGAETAPPDCPTSSGTTRTCPGILTMASGTGVNGPAGPLISYYNSRDRISAWDAPAAPQWAVEIDGRTLTTVTPAAVTVGGFNPANASPPSQVPAGAVLAYAKVFVNHRQWRGNPPSGVLPTAYLQLRVTTTDGTVVGPVAAAGTSTPGLVLRDSPVWAADVVDLLATPALQQVVTARGFTGATITWEVAAQPGRRLNASVDSIQLAMGWTVPAP